MLHTSCFSAFSADELIDKYRQISSFRPTIGIIFSSIALDIPDLVAAIRPEGIPVLGCSTAGEILVEGEAEPFLDQSAVCCFMDFDPALFRISLFERGEETSFTLGQHIGKWGSRQFSKPAFIIAIAGLKNDGEAIVHGIQEVAGTKAPLFGGMAGDDGLLKDTIVFSGDRISHDGSVVLVFDADRVDVFGIASSGWVGIGAEMMITSSEGNTVHTINGRPATDVFKEYLDVKDNDLQQIGINFPLQIRRPDATEVLRTFLSVDFPSGSLTFAGSVPQGSLVRFSSSFGYQTIEQAVRELEAYHADHPHASLLLLFSCIARYRVAGSMAADEVLTASRLWNAPLAGFFTYGEIGHNRLGTCDFYNEALSLVLISLRK
ncbi:MAG: FIST N-terminal domain-containing protein [Methanoregula sp.]|nr:FIST N-terminal domain-containing protein [Methanoregula sp.]